MAQDGTEQRKLAAIMFTDMVGYSALSQRNEALALQLLEEHRSLLRALFPRFNGREVKTIGDAFLVEFHSALEAAQCAIEIQRTLVKRNTDAPAARRIEVKIGIHIGDVVQREDGDVLGDGVNIASRIEPLAGPGGICISVDVERQIRSTIKASLVKLGATELKNIQMPMQLFRIVLPWEDSGTGRSADAYIRDMSSSHKDRASGGIRAPRALVLALLGVLVLGTLGWWIAHRRAASGPSSTNVQARITSLAVKPIDDFSGDTNQAYLSDGMTEALCAALGNISALRVPGRSSVMRYKGGQKSIREMAQELNVDAIVEGSIQRAGNRMLITVQLVEAATDRHLWSTNFERDLTEFFKVQSEVARAIAEEVKAGLKPEDQARLARARTANPAVIEACLLGMHHYWQYSEEGTTNALRYFLRGTEIDPNYAPAHAGAALAYEQAGLWLWPPREVMPKAKEAAQKAIELDAMLADAHVALGYARLNFDWDWAGAEKNFKRAIELSPSSSLAQDAYGFFLTLRGRFDEAIKVLKKALELDPLSPTLHADLGLAYYYSDQPQLAVPHSRKALELDHNFFLAHLNLGLCYLSSQKPSEALTELQTCVQLAPESPWAQMALGYAYGMTGHRAEALKVLVNLDQLAGKRYVTRMAQAYVYLGLEQRDIALDWLEKAYEERDSLMAYLKVEPGLESLRNEPRFQAVLKRVEDGGQEQ